LRAARLLAEIGDARGRFPTPEALASLAGVAPSTRQSGKSRIVGFRCAVDRQLRDALVEGAGDSRLSSPWAADIYGRARARGHDHPHAVRVLARAWVYVIWRCWQDSVAYDPVRHGGAQRLCGPSSASQLRECSGSVLATPVALSHMRIPLRHGPSSSGPLAWGSSRASRTVQFRRWMSGTGEGDHRLGCSLCRVGTGEPPDLAKADPTFRTGRQVELALSRLAGSTVCPD
jgi:hypothetical protein